MATEKRLIDANALLEKVQFRMATDNKNAEIIAGCVDITRRLIENAPTVDAVEVVHGHWNEGKNHSYCCCSNCRDVYILEEWLTDGRWNYCPNCGAKMNGGDQTDG